MTIRLLNVQPNIVWWFILPMSVWVVYTFDHIIDGSKKKDKAVIERHRFHYMNRRILLFLIGIISVTSICLGYLYLDHRIMILGVILSIIIGLYFTLLFFTNNKYITIQKELIIAIVYVVGIIMAPLYWYGELPTTVTLIIFAIIILLAWAEGIIISWFDYNNDIVDGHNSFTTFAGRENTRRFIIALHLLIEALIVSILLLYNVSLVELYSLLILLIMNLILGVIILIPYQSTIEKYHKLIGEFVFFLPALLIVV